MRKFGDREEKVVAITAAMPDGTGLKRFRNMLAHGTMRRKWKRDCSAFLFLILTNVHFEKHWSMRFAIVTTPCWAECGWRSIRRE